MDRRTFLKTVSASTAATAVPTTTVMASSGQDGDIEQWSVHSYDPEGLGKSSPYIATTNVVLATGDPDFGAEAPYEDYVQAIEDYLEGLTNHVGSDIEGYYIWVYNFDGQTEMSDTRNLPDQDFVYNQIDQDNSKFGAPGPVCWLYGIWGGATSDRTNAWATHCPHTSTSFPSSGPYSWNCTNTSIVPPSTAAHELAHTYLRYAITLDYVPDDTESHASHYLSTVIEGPLGPENRTILAWRGNTNEAENQVSEGDCSWDPRGRDLPSRSHRTSPCHRTVINETIEDQL